MQIIDTMLPKNMNEEVETKKGEILESNLKFNLLCEEVCKVFPDYKNDESFGGNKKYIKIDIFYNEYVVLSYINPEIKEYCENECETYLYDEYIIIDNQINKNVADQLKHFDESNSSCLDRIYDINSNDFINKINKPKLNIQIENYDDFKIDSTNMKYSCKIKEKIRQLFHCDMMITNNCLYSAMITEDINYKNFNKLKDFDSFRIDVGIHRYIFRTLYKINSKYYDYDSFLRKYTPYVIRWDMNHNYYIVNRDYEYIGFNSKSIDFNREGQAYLFNDGNKPWDNRNDYIRFL